MSKKTHRTVALSAAQFEAQVEGMLRQIGVGLSDFRVQRLEKIHAADGVYEIDVTARFKALGDVLVLIECKHHRSPIKREVVQILYDKLRAVGAQKGMIFSTVRFQKGAIEFAQAHGIALVLVANGATIYVTRSFDKFEMHSRDLPSYVGWFVCLNDPGEQPIHILLNDYEPLLETFVIRTGEAKSKAVGIRSSAESLLDEVAECPKLLL
jgi:restriction system protein